jgi:exopolyphosphatase/guanosine-5'-triphosphate,3'-diphosphate pyrophosphatase
VTGVTAPSGLGAAIDVGSNSVHLLVASMGRRGLRPVADESMHLGLGRIVDREGRLPADARRAALTVISGYVERARSLGAATVAVVGTEPLRRASNRSLLQAALLRATGVPLHVLTNDQEAGLTLLGVTGGRRFTGTLLVVDIGGGSTELILASHGHDPVVGAMPFGSARLSASFVEHDPPMASELTRLRRAAAELFASMPAGHPTRVVVVGGTGSNLCRLIEGAPECRLDRDALRRALAMVCAEPARTLADRYGVREGRVAQLAAGGALVEAAMDRYGVDSIDASDQGLREGALLASMGAADDWLEQLPGRIGR